MAKVEMDLHELDSMRFKINELENKNKKLEDNSKQVIVYHKHFTGKIKINNEKAKKQNIHINGAKLVNHPYSSSIHYESFFKDLPLDKLWDMGIIYVDIDESSFKTTKDYKNLSEVIDEIRKEELAKVEDKIVELTKKASHYSEKLIIAEDKYDVDIKKLKSKFNKTLEDYREEMESINKEDRKKHLIIENGLCDVYDKLKQDFEDFKLNKERKTIENKLTEAYLTIEELKNELKKPFLKKLFNI